METPPNSRSIHQEGKAGCNRTPQSLTGKWPKLDHMPGWTNFLIPSFEKNRPHWRATVYYKIAKGGEEGRLPIGWRRTAPLWRDAWKQALGSIYINGERLDPRGLVKAPYVSIQIRSIFQKIIFDLLQYEPTPKQVEEKFGKLFWTTRQLDIGISVLVVLQDAADEGGRKSRRPSDGLQDQKSWRISRTFKKFSRVGLLSRRGKCVFGVLKEPDLHLTPLIKIAL